MHSKANFNLDHFSILHWLLECWHNLWKWFLTLWESLTYFKCHRNCYLGKFTYILTTECCVWEGTENRFPWSPLKNLSSASGPQGKIPWFGLILNLADGEMETRRQHWGVGGGKSTGPGVRVFNSGPGSAFQGCALGCFGILKRSCTQYAMREWFKYFKNDFSNLSEIETGRDKW